MCYFRFFFLYDMEPRGLYTLPPHVAVALCVLKDICGKKTLPIFVVFFIKKNSVKNIIASINAAGHDVKSAIASDEQYANIHGCCRYRDEGVRANHGLGDALCTKEKK